MGNVCGSSYQGSIKIVIITLGDFAIVGLNTTGNSGQKIVIITKNTGHMSYCMDPIKKWVLIYYSFKVCMTVLMTNNYMY